MRLRFRIGLANGVGKEDTKVIYVPSRIVIREGQIISLGNIIASYEEMFDHWCVHEDGYPKFAEVVISEGEE